MSEDIRDEGLAELEAGLAGLAPRPPDLDRDRLLFRAGQESAARRGRLWPWATGLLAAVAAGLGAVLILRPEPPPIEHVVYVPVKEQTRPVQPAVMHPAAPAVPADSDEGAAEAAERARFGAFQLQRQVLRWGLGALPSGTPPRDTASPDRGPPPLPEVPRYYQLRVSLRTGGEL
jgi:hypothetical protein